MKNTFTKNTFTLISKQGKAALVLGALTITAALGMTEGAQAAPSSYGNSYAKRGYSGPRNNDRRPRRTRSNRQVFVGTVSNDRGKNLFDLSSGGTTYNVYTLNQTSRRLNTGDRVQVVGKRVGGNDIRDARVIILRNR